MSIRIDPSPLLAGAIVIGVAALGVLGSQVPLTGEHGGGLLANDIVLPAEANDEFRILILTAPAGSLFVYEDSSFTYIGSGGIGTYEGFKNGVSFGTASYTFSAGAGGSLLGSLTLGSIVFSGSLSGGVPPPPPPSTASLAGLRPFDFLRGVA